MGLIATRGGLLETYDDIVDCVGPKDSPTSANLMRLSLSCSV